MKIKIAILEDEISEQKLTLEHLSRFFFSCDIEYEYFIENNGKDFLKHDFSDVDLVLLDIIMDGEINGFDAAKEIRKINDKVSIIFLTKTVQYAVNGYEVKALNYIVKPLIYEDFALKLSIFLKTLVSKGEKEHVFKSKDAVIKLKEKDIYYIDIYKHYLTLHTVNGDYIVRGSMKEIEQILTNVFSRCSSNCIINMMHLDEIKKDDAVVNKDYIKITAKYKNSFLKDLSLYLRDND